jgi:cyclic 2,3-diphosphoglycerate synthetase
VPAIDSHATLLLGTTERPQDLLEGLGAYRIGLADLVLVMGNDPAIGEELCHDITARHAVRAIAASLVPRAVGDIRGRRVAAFTTAPAHVAPLVERELARAGADVALVSCHLAQRAELARDLDAARAAGVDALVVEIKAAAIDAVAEFAATHNIDVVFLDNIPRAHDASIDLDAELAQLVDLARNRASQA